jgi:hypothetical protein
VSRRALAAGPIGAIAVAAIVAAAPAWAAEAASASSALALAALVAENSPTVGTGEKSALASLFGGNADIGYPAGKTITVSADKVVCSASNPDITLHSCELTFGTKTAKLAGRKAHELYATIIEAGVPPDGAAGTIYEAVSGLTCTIDPNEIKQRAGEGAACTFTAGAG